jgi:hypothetical protein
MFGLFYNISLTNNLGSKSDIVNGFDEVYKFAVDMDGAGFAFSGDNDTDISIIQQLFISSSHLS